MEEKCTDSVIPKQLSGKKKRRLLTKINEQMEFYFSDSNLAKDKFLQNLIEQNPEGYVDLEVFKSFNQLKKFTEDIDIIIAAVKKSSILEVKDNKIRRATSLGTKDFDACTLYVEKLPPHVDHKWVKNVFEKFGTVDHVNIPKFKISKKIKGFAFVEFSTPDGVTKACEHYKKTAATSTAESEVEDASPKKDKTKKSSHVRDTEEKCNKKRKAESDTDEPISKKNCSNEEIESSSKDQVTNSDTEKEVSSQKSSKKRKLDSNESDIPLKKAKESELEHQATEEEKEDSFAKNDVQSADGAVSDSPDDTKEKSKHKRKHKKKKTAHSERPTLRVMSKYEWKSYRNRYLALQRSTMSHIKLQIMMQTQELKEMESCGKPETVSEPPKKGIQFQPGVILKVTLSDPIENCSEIKDKIKAITAVAYIDAPLGHTELFIRCHNPEEAKTIIGEEKLSKVGSVQLLQGSDEETYWKKIEDERKAKFSIPLTHKKRGRDKIIARAAKLAEQKNKHIYFDE